jgi:hypothetical protein
MFKFNKTQPLKWELKLSPQLLVKWLLKLESVKGKQLNNSKPLSQLLRENHLPHHLQLLKRQLPQLLKSQSPQLQLQALQMLLEVTAMKSRRQRLSLLKCRLKWKQKSKLLKTIEPLSNTHLRIKTVTIPRINLRD